MCYYEVIRLIAGKERGFKDFTDLGQAAKYAKRYSHRPKNAKYPWDTVLRKIEDGQVNTLAMYREREILE